MSYYAVFKGLTDQVMDKYNKKNRGIFGHSTNNEYKTTLKVFVLQEPPKETETYRIPDVKSSVFTIKVCLGGIESQINEAEEQFAYDRYKENGYLWYCGWQFSKDQCEHDREDIYDYVVERLTLLKHCTETGNYFDSEHNNFHEKLKEITEVLEYFEDTMREIKIFEIMEELKEYRRNDDDDDNDDEKEIINPLEKPESLDPIKEITENVNKAKK